METVRFPHTVFPKSTRSGVSDRGNHIEGLVYAVKIPPAMQKLKETQVQPLGQEDPWEEETATHSSILAWRVPWTEKPGGRQWSDLACTCAHEGLSESGIPEALSHFSMATGPHFSLPGLLGLLAHPGYWRARDAESGEPRIPLLTFAFLTFCVAPCHRCPGILWRRDYSQSLIGWSVGSRERELRVHLVAIKPPGDLVNDKCHGNTVSGNPKKQIKPVTSTGPTTSFKRRLWKMF